MSISLQKGGSFNLSKKEPGLQKIMIGLGWEMLDANPVDLDASVFMLNRSKKLPGDQFFVFYNNLVSGDGALEHTGDNRTGIGEGDDEMILANLSKIQADVQEIIVLITIHDAAVKRHNFGMLQDAYIRIMDVETKRVILQYDLDNEFPAATEVVFGRLVKESGDWVFRAVGEGFNVGLQGFVNKYA